MRQRAPTRPSAHAYRPEDPSLMDSPLTLTDRILGWNLGLGDLADLDAETCHGYANCCICTDCRERAKNPKQTSEPAKQPWDIPSAA